MTIWGIGPRIFLHTAWISSPIVAVHILLADRLRADVPPAVWWYVVGGAMMVLGLAGVRLGSHYVRRHWRQGQLCTTGPYRWCRNPLYASWILLVVPGLMLVLRMPGLLGVPVIMYLVLCRLIRREESYLEERFGEAWRRYRDRTNRLWPRRPTKDELTPRG